MEEGQYPAPCWVLECRGIEVRSQGSRGLEVHQLEGSLTEQGTGAQGCHHCGLTRNAIPPPVGARGLEGAVGDGRGPSGQRVDLCAPGNALSFGQRPPAQGDERPQTA